MAHITRGNNFVACKIATTYGDDPTLEGLVVLYIQVFQYELQWVPLPRYSLSVLGFQKQWRCGFCNLRRLGMYPSSLRVPGLGVGTLHCHCMGSHAGWVFSSCPWRMSPERFLPATRGQQTT